MYVLSVDVLRAMIKTGASFHDLQAETPFILGRSFHVLSIFKAEYDSKAGYDSYKDHYHFQMLVSKEYHYCWKS